VAVGLLSSVVLATSAPADSLIRAQVQNIGSKPGGISPEQPEPTKPLAGPPTRTSDASGNFVYEILNTIRARAAELCARYDSPDDCLEEAELCLTMRNAEEDQVRLCLNTAPGESGQDKAQKTRVRR
jgi:hypothetical protein